jgi:hypothetical protein
MRIQAYSLMSTMTFLGVAVAGFVGACGGKVVVDGSNPAGGGGAGGAGGGVFAIVASAAVTTAAVTTGSSITTGPIMTTGGPGSSGASMDVSASVGTGPDASSSVAASSSTGVVNACDDACNKATMCGLNFCSQFGINCANPPMQAQCPLACIAAGSCGDIAKLAMQNFATPLGACIIGCQGMGPGSAVSVGSTGSGPPPMGCQQCTFQQCGGPIFQCNAKKGPGSCSQWLQCAQGCGQDSMCLFGCDMQFPNAAPQYDVVYSCLCNSCDASCPAENACGHLGPVPPGP